MPKGYPGSGPAKRPVMKPRARKSLSERFWPNVQPAANGCWLWIGKTRDKDGYGLIRDADYIKQGRAHRISFVMEYGEIPPGMWVLHRCDTPACVNPYHLFLGDNIVNSADREAKGRGNPTRGEAHSSAKLTDEIVKAIREAPGTGREIARKFGTTPQQVSRVRLRQRWTHV